MIAAAAVTSCAVQPSQPHAARSGEPNLVQLNDFSYEDYTPAQAAQINIKATVDGLNASTPGFVTESSVHWVHGGSGEPMTLVALHIDRSAVPGEFPETSLLEGVLGAAAGPLASMTERTIGDQRVGVADVTWSGHPRRVVYAWIRGDVVTVVLSQSPSQVEAFAKAALASNR